MFRIFFQTDVISDNMRCLPDSLEHIISDVKVVGCFRTFTIRHSVSQSSVSLTGQMKTKGNWFRNSQASLLTCNEDEPGISNAPGKGPEVLHIYHFPLLSTVTKYLYFIYIELPQINKHLMQFKKCIMYIKYYEAFE